MSDPKPSHEQPDLQPITHFVLEGAWHPRAGGWYLEQPQEIDWNGQHIVLVVRDGRFTATIDGPMRLERHRVDGPDQ